jgi:heptaprenyl diphosphate synthase
MNPGILTPRQLKIATELQDWSFQYLVSDNPNIQRPAPSSQATCPFVAGSLENNSYYMAFHPEINGQNEQLIEQIMLGYIEQFIALQPTEPSKLLLKALLVVFPELSKGDAHILDIVHPRIKANFVKEGLMVGQFHPNCNERGIHNRAYRVSVSPYPLIAMRHMALHDIVLQRSIWRQVPRAGKSQGLRKAAPGLLPRCETKVS